MSKEYQIQDNDYIYALDIGTRSIIGIVARAVDDRVEVLAIEKQEHEKRAMLDGQIEDINQVARVVRQVTDRLEERLHCQLKRVCIAAAGRALRTETGRFELKLPAVRRIDEDTIVRLESGAVSEAEKALIKAEHEQDRFYLVGYTPMEYQLDRYPLSTLLDHNGQNLEVEVVATFLPAEVVESLYSAMQRAELEVASLTLEPIAAMNAAIPAELRLLNLVLADIGAGTSDIAVCRDGKIIAYTMATIAGDEITEAVMRAYLVDFNTAEMMKIALAHQETIAFTDILGMEQEVTPEELSAAIAASMEALADELAKRICEANGGNAPSALFLSGGGSKLNGFCARVAEVLGMDAKRVAVAGNNFKKSAFSSQYDLEDPEYATPLGIAISAGLGLINDSYRINLNGQSAKLFRSGTLTILEVLMMNGYSYAHLIGRTGRALSITVDGQRMVFRGEPATPSALLLNGKETSPSAIVNTGDSISFTPASGGKAAARTIGDVLETRHAVAHALLNGQPATFDQPLESGDVILTNAIAETPMVQPPIAEQAPIAQAAAGNDVVETLFFLNGSALMLMPKADAAPYYLMDMLEHTEIDFEHLERPVELLVNGLEAAFTQELHEFDKITIRYVEES